jgi:hypothetical protein
MPWNSHYRTKLFVTAGLLSVVLGFDLPKPLNAQTPENAGRLKSASKHF